MKFKKFEEELPPYNKIFLIYKTYEPSKIEIVCGKRTHTNAFGDHFGYFYLGNDFQYNFHISDKGISNPNIIGWSAIGVASIYSPSKTFTFKNDTYFEIIEESPF